MGKSRRHHQPQKPQRYAGVYLTEHPFNSLDKAKLSDALSQIGRDAQEEFNELVAELRRILESVDALHAISNLVTYGLSVSMDSDGTTGDTYSRGTFTQAHVELCTAFALQASRGTEPATADIVQRLLDLLPQLTKAFNDRRFAQISESGSAKERAVAMLQDHLRLHTQSVRNWSYYDEVVSTVQCLVGPLDCLWEKEFGVTAIWLVKFFSDRVDEFDDILTTRLMYFREIDAESTLDGFIGKLFDRFPAPEAIQRNFAEHLKSHAPLTRDQRRDAFFQYSDALLVPNFLFSSDETAARYGIDAAAVDALFTKLSLTFGSLIDRPNDFAFLSNPVWTKPLVSLGRGTYFCALPQAFFTFAFQTINELVAASAPLQKAWARQRATFLEAEIESELRKAFPRAQLYPNFKWQDATGTFENDLLVQIDSHLIIVEAKSGSVSWPALRGAPERAKRHFSELILEPSMQSLRLKEKLQDLFRNPDRAPTELPGLCLDIAKIKTVLRLSVTLEDFAVVQTNTSLAVEAGWVPEGHELPPTIILSDLRAVLFILESQAQRIQYLQRRQTIQQSLDYVGDEMDLLGVHLANGFDMGNFESSGASLVITGMSASIDEFFDARSNGIARTPPRRKLTKWWRDICTELERREFYGWTQAATILLDVGFDDQQTLEQKFKRIRNNVMKHWRDPSHHSSVVLTPPQSRGNAIIAFAYRDAVAHEYRDAMDSIVSKVLSAHAHVDTCLVLGVNMDKKQYPYSTLSVFQR